MNHMLSWRAQLLDTDLHRNAKYLALILSTYMNEWGDSAFPGIPALIGRSGMSKSTLERAMKELVDAGWLLKQNRYREDGGQTSNNYIATHPEYGVPDRNAPRPNLKRAPSQADTHNSSVNSSPKPIDTCALFEKWWEEYPKKVAKKACLARWRKLNLEDNGEQLIADVCKRVKKDRKWIDGYAPNPLTYLNGERWHDDIEPVPSERPVNGAPKTHSQWHQWCRKNGYGDGPIGFSEAKFISWATDKYRRQNDDALS